MSQETVVVWCDLAPEVGVGHLMRCVALAEELSARGRRVHFLVDAGRVPFAAAQLKARGMGSTAPAATRAEQLEQLAAHHPEAVVIDSYRLPPETYAAVRARHRTLAFVDGEIGGRDADLFLDQNIGAETDDRALPSAAVRLAGLRFALMRDEVLAHRPTVPDAGDGSAPPRVLAFFGGTDAFGAAPVLAPVLAATGLDFHLTVVATTDESRQALAAVGTAPGQQIDVIAPTDQLSALVRRSDLVISAAGTSSWELLCLGAAVAFVCVADNQAEAYERVEEQRLAVPLGSLGVVRDDPEGATAALRAILTDAAERARLRRTGWELVDGRGRARVADALLR